jgi:SPP1 gp7 family putative phage head morphogenesis protein
MITQNFNLNEEEVLRPTDVSNVFETDIEKIILDFLQTTLLDPLAKHFITEKKRIFSNSINALVDAINSGKIIYTNGYFTGQFNATLSKTLINLGAKFNKTKSGFVINRNYLPVLIQNAIYNSSIKSFHLQQSMLENINQININKQLKELDFTPVYSNLLNKLDQSNTVDKVLGVPVELTPQRKKKIAEDYSNNLKLYIKKFSDEQVVTLRKDIEENILNGLRAESLKDYLVDKYNVSEKKAKFLAKQETNLLKTTYTASRYQEAGVEKFVWSSSRDSRTRPEHKLLDGQIFSFNNLPIIDLKTGKKGLPGEAFGCRCKMKPIV